MKETSFFLHVSKDLDIKARGSHLLDMWDQPGSAMWSPDQGDQARAYSSYMALVWAWFSWFDPNGLQAN